MSEHLREDIDSGAGPRVSEIVDPGVEYLWDSSLVDERQRRVFGPASR